MNRRINNLLHSQTHQLWFKRVYVSILFLLLTSVNLSNLAAAQDPTNVDNEFFQKRILPSVKAYCFDCHGGGASEGDVDLGGFETIEDVMADLETWSHVLSVLRVGDMPPEGEKQPDRLTTKFIQKWIIASIRKSKDAHSPRGALRRLSRFEYENTIRDLFRLDRNCFNNSVRIVQTQSYFNPASKKMPRHVLGVSYYFSSSKRHSDLPGVSSLPVDPPVEHGFANEQGALSLSPLLMESYLEISNALLESDNFALISGIWQLMFTADESDSKELQTAMAKENLHTFLPRAFRRTPTEAEIDRYMRLFESEFATDGSYREAMKTTVSAILVSPHFLYRSEFHTPEPNGDDDLVPPMDESHAMASRLSYFLWGSMPDDQLFQAAREKRLLSRAGLARQVDRMMLDKKVKSLSIDFGMQWLKVQKATSLLPDRDKFPNYYVLSTPPPAISMMIEQMLLFETIMVENRSILEFIQADYAYLNRQLMNWYQLDPIAVLGYAPPRENFEDYFRIKWNNPHRGGVITSGAMLMSTSTTTRTSPVYRGAWILDVIFNSPPPPAPPGVPPLDPAEGKHDVALNVRDKLESHRQDPACASCHDRIDPLGFALEGFDPIGHWRKSYETGDDVDMTGVLDGIKFVGPARFKAAILRNEERFVRAFVQHTLKYALGRQLHYSDEPEVQRITEKVLEQDCRFHSVIREVVLSDLFRSTAK